MMMKNQVYNSILEISLRLLLAFSCNPESCYTIDMAAAIDLLAIYSKSFGLSDRNINGDSIFKFSEFAARRGVVQEALKNLLQLGLVIVKGSDEGFVYSISEKGKQIANNFVTSYSQAYRHAVKKAMVIVKKLDDARIVSFINEISIKTLQEGEQ